MSQRMIDWLVHVTVTLGPAKLRKLPERELAPHFSTISNRHATTHPAGQVMRAARQNSVRLIISGCKVHD